MPETISVKGSKTWEDGNNQDGIRPESITVNLLANGKVVKTATVTEEDNWNYVFSDLPKYANGKEIVYTVSEEEVTGYEVKVDGYNIINTHVPETISVKGSKTWEDGNNQDGIRPESITVNLLANGKVVKTATVTEEDNWNYVFSDLPKYANGKEIVYTVSEEEVTGYEVKVDGYNIINTHVPETISVEGSKTWEDGNNQDGIRPESITVNLLADGKVVKTATVTEEDNWSYVFSNLPKYANGKEIVYTVSEEEVTGYEVKVDGYNLINTHVPKAENETTPNTNNNDQNLPPKTGDHVDIMLFVIIGTVSFIQMIIVCILKKKKTLK